MAYSFIGLQTVYLATYFPDVYWNTACLRVSSGLDEDASTDYGKIGTAVGNVKKYGTEISLIDINKSGYMFEPDEENNRILYGLKALNGVGGDIVQEIITNRPYNSWQDFVEKIKPKKTVMISLVKSGAFDCFQERKKTMEEYIMSICNPKKRLTLQNFNSLRENGLIPRELTFQSRLFVFNKGLRKRFKKGAYLYLTDPKYYAFYEKYFPVEELEDCDGTVILEKEWKKLYTKAMVPAKEYIIKHQEELLENINGKLFLEEWNKYAKGSYSRWEMESLGMYYHRHELSTVEEGMYAVSHFDNLPKEPVVKMLFRKKIPIYETTKIMGVVVAKDDLHSCFSLLTRESGVVTVKMSREHYANYNKRISEIMPDGTKKVRENGWFRKGTPLMVNGYRRGDMFVVKAYRRNNDHSLYKIKKIYKNGSVQMTHCRFGEED